MKTVVVTGGCGFIGVNLCKKLVAQGKYVIVIDSTITGATNQRNSFLENPHITFFHHDITHPLPSELLTKADTIESIYHLACPTGVPNLTRLAEEMLLTCSIGTRNILELAKIANATLVFTSSSEVYGDPTVSPQTETYTGNVSSIGIRSPYEEGKRFSESLLVMYVRKYHINAKIIRVFNTYGPHMQLSDTRVIPRFIKHLIENLPLPLHGEGEQTRTFCYVDDLVDALLLVSEKGLPGEVYNAGSTHSITIKALAKLMLSLAKKEGKIVSEIRPSHDHQSRMPDLTKIQRLGWRQKISLEEGLAWTMRWYGL